MICKPGAGHDCCFQNKSKQIESGSNRQRFENTLTWLNNSIRVLDQFVKTFFSYTLLSIFLTAHPESRLPQTGSVPGPQESSQVSRVEAKKVECNTHLLCITESHLIHLNMSIKLKGALRKKKKSKHWFAQTFTVSPIHLSSILLFFPPEFPPSTSPPSPYSTRLRCLCLLSSPLPHAPCPLPSHLSPNPPTQEASMSTQHPSSQCKRYALYLSPVNKHSTSQDLYN